MLAIIFSMCGISAIFCASSKNLSGIRAMNDAIKHRGPDDEGYVLFSRDHFVVAAGVDTPEEVISSPRLHCPKETLRDFPDGIAAVGHRRLSIIDLSPASHQPISSDDQRYWLTYNGEIYNYPELKQELENLGHSFYSLGDGEVLLKAYLQWGVDFLNKCNGMFSFVLYDRAAHSLFAARDRFGVKPLYYWISPDGCIAFASEIKQFFSLPGWSAGLNHHGAYNFLVHGLTDHEEETLFKGVFQLQGGAYLFDTVKNLLDRPITPKRWYCLPTQLFEGSFDEAVKIYRELLIDSVKLRLRSDVPVGSCLSGGLDSSSIVSIIHHLLSPSNEQKQYTFTACSHHKSFDESRYSDHVANEKSIHNEKCYPKLSDVFDNLDRVLYYQDEPFGSTSIFAQWEVFKSAGNQGIKVMLDGQGADEQLAGYSGYQYGRLLELFQSGRYKDVFSEYIAARKLHSLKIPYRTIARKLLPLQRKKPWCSLSPSALSPYRGRDHSLPYVNQMNYLQTTRTNLPMLLRYEDRDSMAHSIEARTPFVDYRLITFSQSLPSDFKIHYGITKKILRESLKGILPDLIRDRTCKLGFATPEEIWVRNEMPERFQEELQKSIVYSDGILNHHAKKLGVQMILGKKPFSFLLWRKIIFGRWMQNNHIKTI